MNPCKIHEEGEEKCLPPISCDDWLNYVTPSSLGFRKYPDREDPKLARRKWYPPHNMGESQTESTLDKYI